LLNPIAHLVPFFCLFEREAGSGVAEALSSFRCIEFTEPYRIVFNAI